MGDTSWPTAALAYAHQARRGIRRALAAEVAAGDLTERQAMDVATRIMRANQYDHAGGRLRRIERHRAARHPRPSVSRRSVGMHAAREPLFSRHCTIEDCGALCVPAPRRAESAHGRLQCGGGFGFARRPERHLEFVEQLFHAREVEADRQHAAGAGGALLQGGAVVHQARGLGQRQRPGRVGGGHLAGAVNVLVALVVGGESGFIGGRLDLTVQRFVDAWMSIPGLLILLTVMSVVGRGVLQIIVVLGCWAASAPRGWSEAR